MAHLKTLAEFPPLQSVKSFDRSNMIQDFLQAQRRMQPN
jgi:arylsulfatase